MRKWFVLAGILALTLSTAGVARAFVRDDEETIKKVMKEALKGPLCKSVAEGKATKEDKEKLLDLFKEMLEAKPHKGDEASWKEKCEALVEAAQAAVDGKADAGKLLKSAANCKACHEVHK